MTPVSGEGMMGHFSCGDTGQVPAVGQGLVNDTVTIQADGQ